MADRSRPADASEPPAPPPGVTVLDHPLVATLLTTLRDRDTPPHAFREAAGRLGTLLAYEATRDSKTQPHPIHTPLARHDGTRLAAPLSVVPILRAGMALSTAILDLFPDAQMGHLGMFRDENALSPVHYYEKLPASIARGPVLLCDPMVATGGSVIAAVELLKTRGCTDIRLLCLVASTQGLTHLHEEHPHTRTWACAIDPTLDDRGYIVPGLGDAGDRTFGTVEEHRQAE